MNRPLSYVGLRYAGLLAIMLCTYMSLLTSYGIQEGFSTHMYLLPGRGLNTLISRFFSHCGPLRTHLFHVGIDFGHNIRRELFKFVLWQRFREKIAYIPFSFDMSDEILRFLDTVSQPEKPEIHAFRSFSVDGVCCQSLSHSVVHQDRCGLAS